jgi:hypothetical protein
MKLANFSSALLSGFQKPLPLAKAPERSSTHSAALMVDTFQRSAPSRSGTLSAIISVDLLAHEQKESFINTAKYCILKEAHSMTTFLAGLTIEPALLEKLSQVPNLLDNPQADQELLTYYGIIALLNTEFQTHQKNVSQHNIAITAKWSEIIKIPQQGSVSGLLCNIETLPPTAVPESPAALLRRNTLTQPLREAHQSMRKTFNRWFDPEVVHLID